MLERKEKKERKEKTAANAPSAADLSKMVDRLSASKSFDDLGVLPFKHGDVPNGALIIDLDVKTCQSVLDTHDNLGFDLERRLRSRINMKKMETAR